MPAKSRCESCLGGSGTARPASCPWGPAPRPRPCSSRGWRIATRRGLRPGRHWRLPGRPGRSARGGWPRSGRGTTSDPCGFVGEGPPKRSWAIITKVTGIDGQEPTEACKMVHPSRPNAVDVTVSLWNSWGLSSAARTRTKYGVRLRWIHPDDEVLPVNPDRHVAAQEKGNAAEHLLLDDSRSTRELFPDPFGLRFRIRHRFPARTFQLMKLGDDSRLSPRSRASSVRTRRSSTDES